MADHNPYAAPTEPSDAGDDPGSTSAAPEQLVLAHLLQRLVGAMVDTVLAWGVRLLMIRVALDIFRPALASTPEEASRLFLFSRLVTDGSSALFFGIQGFLISRRGQSIGKMMLGMRIVRPDGRPAGLVRGFLLRTGLLVLLTWLVVTLSSMPSLFSAREQITLLWVIVLAVDSLLIFGASRRCAHDIVADTVVVRAHAPNSPRLDRVADADDPPARRRKKPTRKKTKKTPPPPADLPA
jgi:uncharacterized RDD family membrane protein YckC